MNLFNGIMNYDLYGIEKCFYTITKWNQNNLFYWCDSNTLWCVLHHHHHHHHQHHHDYQQHDFDCMILIVWFWLHDFDCMKVCKDKKRLLNVCLRAKNIKKKRQEATPSVIIEIIYQRWWCIFIGEKFM